ncbi:MAG: hypothetical protein AAFV33_18690 [Chloroflexota bacterium]
MLQVIGRPLLMLITLLALCVGVIRAGYGLAYPPPSRYAGPDCTAPCVLGIQPRHTTQPDVERRLDAANMVYSDYHMAFFGSKLHGVAVQHNDDSDELIEYADSDGTQTVSYITTVKAGRCTPEFLLELGMPDDAYVSKRDPVSLFIYRDYGLVFIFTEQARPADLALEIVGVWQSVRNRPVATPGARNTAIVLFNHCR